jgi:DNA (cytosine-5)-methyltransferase 1
MRYLSLFSGIEAATQAWHPLGWEPVAFAEIEPFPCAVLAHHYPDVPNLGSVTDISDEQIAALGPIDLVVGGSPCQDLSVAGKRAGLVGERSGLFAEQMRIFHAARRLCGARYLLWENVPGAFSSNKGRDFAVVVGEMAGSRLCVPRNGWQTTGAALGENGLCEWAVLDAQWFGVAQRRRRVFALLDTGDWASRPPVLLERESLSGDSPPSREAREEVAKCLTTRTGSALDPETETLPVCFPSSANTDAMQAAGNNVRPSMLTTAPPAVAYGLPGNWIGRKPENGGNQAQPSIEHSPCLTSTDRHAVAFDTTQITSPQNGSNPKPGDPCHPLCAGAHVPAVASQMAVRRLTPTECEALQGFPRNYTRIPYRNKPADQCPDGPRYKALGNSFAVPVVKWIGEQIEGAHRD